MGRKPLPEGTESITFNVQKEVWDYLGYLVRMSSIGGTEEEVAQHIFREAMREAEGTGKYVIMQRIERRDDQMPKKKPPDPNEKPQHERFKEAAEKSGADKSGKAFERAFGKIVPPKKPTGQDGR